MTRTYGSSIWLVLLSLSLAMCAPAAAADAEFKAGGVTLVLPGTGDFVEAGDKLRTTLFELMAPSANRLVSAYAPAKTLADLNAGKTGDGLDLYALVEVPRAAEYAELTPADFAQVLNGMESAMGSFDVNSGTAQEMNARLKMLGAKPVELGKPEMLGGLFKKRDVAGFAMLMAMKQQDRSTTMACAMGVMRLKQRLIFVYIYRKYESQETVTWLSKALEAWCDQLLKSNS